MQTLLIVDDDPAIREVFSLLLAKNGYSVNAVAGGDECLNYFNLNVPDLVMLDIMMHPLDGWETLTAIRTNPLTRQIPAIMFSGKSPSREELVRYGGWIEDYLMKPLTLPVITWSLSSVGERLEVNMSTRNRFLQNGADPALVEEYFQLQHLLFIYGKFFPDLPEDTRSGAGVPLRQKTRYEELGRLLQHTGQSGDVPDPAGGAGK